MIRKLSCKEVLKVANLIITDIQQGKNSGLTPREHWRKRIKELYENQKTN